MNQLLLRPKGLGPYCGYAFDHGSFDTYAEVDSTPTIRITPRAHFNSDWFWWCYRSRHWSGKTPHFLFDKSACAAEPVAGERFGVWSTSPDTDTWTDFATVTVGVADIDIVHSSAFPSGKIYVAKLPMYPFSRVERKVEEWQADPRITSPASATDFVIGNATARSSGDSSGRTVPALPYYGLKVTNASGYTKNKMILTAFNHPDEVQGAYLLEGAVNWLLAGSVEAEFILDWFDVYIYPCLNPQGVWSGFYRSCPENAGQDHNRLWNTTGTLECIDAFKAAFTTDTGGAFEVGLDFHADDGNDTYYGAVYDNTEALHVAYAARLLPFATGYDQRTYATAGMLHVLWHDSYAARLQVTLEQCNALSLGVTGWKAFGANALKTIALMQADGRWTNGPGVGSRDFTAVTNRIDWASVANLSGHAQSISFWVKMDTLPTNGYVLCIHDSDAVWGLIVNISNAVSGYVGVLVNGTTFMQHSSEAGAITTGTWIQVVITWDGVITTASSVHIYKNAVETAYSVTTNGATETNHAGKWCLGGRYYDDTRNLADGKLAQVGVWDRVLTSTEIANLAAGQAPDLAAASGLQFYFKGNTSSLVAVPGGEGTADGTTQLTGVGTGPSIIYG